ncbi:MAG: MFS transporter [Proteobacteria bacterium]|nr:MFS transporter [Pseudomonadota bacterium]
MDDPSAASKPDLTLWRLISMSVGFFGIQHGFEIQFARMSSIFEQLGAKPDEIPLLWLAAPATGLVIQPIVGYLSDKTWLPRLRARRRPFFLAGAILGTVALVLMPSASSLWMAAGLLWVLDAALNVTMEPFRAFVADMQNSRQRPTGYAMQSVMIGLGTILGNFIASIDLPAIFPALRASGKSAMHYSFYLCAAIFIAAVLWTVVSTPEYPPDASAAGPSDRPAGGVLAALVAWWRETKSCYLTMPPVMKHLALVQFFTWMGLFCMWMFYAVAVPHNVFGATDPHSARYDAGVRFAAATVMARGLATPLFALLIPVLVRRFGRANTHALALAVAGLGLLAVPLIHTPGLLYLPMIAAGVGWASVVSMPYVILVDHLPKHQYGIFMGIFNMFIVIPEICVSLGLGGLIMGLLQNNRAYGVAFGGALLLVAALLTPALRRYEPQAR